MPEHRGTLCLTFDNMGSAAAVGRGEVTGQIEHDQSLEVAYPRILDLLDELALKASFFLEGWNTLHNPELVRTIHDRGHEISLHGWVHEVFHKLSPFDAERLLLDSQAGFRQLGIEPVGFRAPGGVRNLRLVPILQKLGMKYDSSVDEAATATKPFFLEGGLPCIPWTWAMIDYYQYHMHSEGPRTPKQLEILFNANVRTAAADGSNITLIFHAFASGECDERFDTLRNVLEAAVANERIEVLTAGALAARMVRD